MVEKRILGFRIDSLITSSCDAAVKSADSRGRRQESCAGLGKFVFALCWFVITAEEYRQTGKGLESAAIIA